MAVGVVAQRLVAALVAVACLMLAVPSSAVAVGASVAKPSKVPTVPLDLTVVPGPASGQLVVSWAPPAYDGSYLNRFGQPVAYVLTDYDLKGIPAASWRGVSTCRSRARSPDFGPGTPTRSPCASGTPRESAVPSPHRCR